MTRDEATTIIRNAIATSVAEGTMHPLHRAPWDRAPRLQVAVDRVGGEAAASMIGTLEKGERVYWNDPDDGLCSGLYTVVRHEGYGCYFLRNDAGSELEAQVNELEKVKS